MGHEREKRAGKFLQIDCQLLDFDTVMQFDDKKERVRNA